MPFGFRAVTSLTDVLTECIGCVHQAAQAQVAEKGSIARLDPANSDAGHHICGHALTVAAIDASPIERGLTNMRRVIIRRAASSAALPTDPVECAG